MVTKMSDLTLRKMTIFCAFAISIAAFSSIQAKVPAQTEATGYELFLQCSKLEYPPYKITPETLQQHSSLSTDETLHFLTFLAYLRSNFPELANINLSHLATVDDFTVQYFRFLKASEIHRHQISYSRSRMKSVFDNIEVQNPIFEAIGVILFYRWRLQGGRFIDPDIDIREMKEASALITENYGLPGQCLIQTLNIEEAIFCRSANYRYPFCQIRKDKIVKYIEKLSILSEKLCASTLNISNRYYFYIWSVSLAQGERAGSICLTYHDPVPICQVQARERDYERRYYQPDLSRRGESPGASRIPALA